MALGEAARFATLVEAHIACSVLNSAGIRAETFDSVYGGNVWTNQFMLGGLRVMAPQSQLEDAKSLLQELRVADPEAIAWQRHPKVWSGFPLAMAGVLFGSLGWAFAVLRQRFTITRLLVVTYLVVGVALLWWAPYLFPQPQY